MQPGRDPRVGQLSEALYHAHLPHRHLVSAGKQPDERGQPGGRAGQFQAAARNPAPARLGNLRQPLALETRLLRGIHHARVREEVAHQESPVRRRAQLELGLEAADAREVEVLTLPAGRPHGAVGEARGERHVRNQVVHLVPVAGDPAQQRSPPLLHAELASRELLGAKRLVGDGHVVAHAEHAVLLVERRHAEALISGRAQVGGGRRVVEQRHAPARDDALDVVEGLLGGNAGRGRGVVPGGVVAVPVVAADAADDLQGRNRREHILDEDAGDELLAPGVPRAGARQRASTATAASTTTTGSATTR